jgi:hypothetical protein
LVLQQLYDCNENTVGRNKSGPQLQCFCWVATVTCLLQQELGAEADLEPRHKIGKDVYEWGFEPRWMGTNVVPNCNLFQGCNCYNLLQWGY